LLPLAEGLATTGPVLPFASPIRNASGTVIGALVYETAVSADSAFNQEVAPLKAGKTGRYLYLDRNNIVVASSDETALAKPVDSKAVGTYPSGIHRADGHIAIVAPVDSADWRLAFEQTIDEFEGDITGPLRRALLLGLGAATIAGVVAVSALLRRLATAREEQRRLSEIAAAREEFTSIVSHELRTPVAGLLGFLETAVDHWDGMTDADRHRSVQRAYANARTLRSLTADVLDSAAIDAHALVLHPETVDLRSIIDESVELVRAVDGERSLAVTCPDQPVMVHADPSRLGQVVTNLLDNATRSSPAGSPVEVTLAVTAGAATISVRDRGSGIALEDRERVFEKFVRGAGVTARGSGLGLYIARNLVEAHGGRIWAAAAPDGGAVIVFTVPVVETAAVAGT
jgi:signal transduction histidine kinase